MIFVVQHTTINADIRKDNFLWQALIISVAISVKYAIGNFILRSFVVKNPFRLNKPIDK